MERSKPCVKCGRLFRLPPTAAPRRCPACTETRCAECGRLFHRDYRKDRKKDAGVYCCKGCYWAARRKGGGGGDL